MQGTQTEKYLKLIERVARDWRMLHNEELHNWLPSSNVVMAIRPKRMR